MTNSILTRFASFSTSSIVGLILFQTGAGAQAAAERPESAVVEPAFPRPGELPAGVVLDENSKPIAGARVTLLAATTTDSPFGAAIARLLQQTPLPAMASQRDGSFVLPLTFDQRQLGAAGEGRFWLQVQKVGYLEWREPLLAGLAGYMGSRVVLRKKRPNDRFATIPWPPTSESMSHPWIPVPKSLPALAANRHGSDHENRPGKSKRSTDQRRRRLTIQVIDAENRSVRGASVLFGNSSYGTGAASFPFRADDGGSLTADLALGDHEIRIAATGFEPRIEKLTVAAQSPETPRITLRKSDRVDVLAVDVNGRPVPFSRMDIVAKDLGASSRPPMVVRSDSAGRIRMALVDRSAYFAYSHFGVPPKRVALDAPRDGNRIIRVPQFRTVTAIIEADDLPKRGNIHWKSAAGEVFRGFTQDRKSGPVVARVYARDHIEVWFGGQSTPPIVIRKTDLAPAPREPLLDLAFVSRKLRKRADILLTSSSGGVVRDFAIRPTWQVDGRWTRPEMVRFDRRAGNRIEFFVRDNEGWSFWARDDGAYELMATAKGHEPRAVSIPARGPNTELPRSEIKLHKR